MPTKFFSAGHSSVKMASAVTKISPVSDPRVSHETAVLNGRTYRMIALVVVMLHSGNAGLTESQTTSSACPRIPSTRQLSSSFVPRIPPHVERMLL